ncbi:MAG TPA: hypothetical protein PKL77_11535, partial [Candidatus Omnitrophota bacterium]|nr:hypothetical protein [Candidatus Omnitrophota bacterium]
SMGVWAAIVAGTVIGTVVVVAVKVLKGRKAAVEKESTDEAGSQESRTPSRAICVSKTTLSNVVAVGVHIALGFAGLYVGAIAGVSLSVIVPSAIVLLSFAFLVKDVLNWKNGKSAHLWYGANAFGLTSSQRYGVKKVVEDILTSKDPHYGKFPHMGVKAALWQKTALGFVTSIVLSLAGVALAVTSGAATAHVVVIAAVVGYLSPWLISALADFFLASITRNQLTADVVRDMRADSNSDIVKRVAFWAARYEEANKVASKFGKAYNAIGDLKQICVISLPEVTGVVQFAASRALMVAVSGVFATAVVALINPAFTTVSIFDIVTYAPLVKVFVSLGLPHSVAEILRLAIIVTGLSLLRLPQQFEEISNITANKKFGLPTFNAVALMRVKEDEEKYAQIRDILGAAAQQGLLRDGGLAGAAKALGFDNGRMNFKNWGRSVMVPAIVSVIVLIVAPFMGLVKLAFLKAEKENMNPYFAAFLDAGVKWWNSFFYMATIGAEISGVIKSGEFLAHHNVAVVRLIGQPISQYANYLEREYGAISWGQHFLDTLQKHFHFDAAAGLYHHLGGHGDFTPASVRSHMNDQLMVEGVNRAARQDLLHKAETYYTQVMDCDVISGTRGTFAADVAAAAGISESAVKNQAYGMSLSRAKDQNAKEFDAGAAATDFARSIIDEALLERQIGKTVNSNMFKSRADVTQEVIRKANEDAVKIEDGLKKVLDNKKATPEARVQAMKQAATGYAELVNRLNVQGVDRYNGRQAMLAVYADVEP